MVRRGGQQGDGLCGTVCHLDNPHRQCSGWCLAGEINHKEECMGLCVGVCVWVCMCIYMYVCLSL